MDKKLLHKKCGRGGPRCPCCTNHTLTKKYTRAVRHFMNRLVKQALSTEEDL